MAREGYFGENSILPSFLKRKKSDHADPTASKTATPKHSRSSDQLDQTKQSTASLRSLEQSAASSMPGQGIASDLEHPSITPSFYTGTGRSKSRFGSRAKKPSLSLTKRAPLAAVILLIIFGGFTIISSNSLLGPHISALTTSSTNIGRAAISKIESNVLSYLSKRNLIPKTLQKRFVESGATKATSSTIEFKGKALAGDDIARAIDDDIQFADLTNKATYSQVLDFHDHAANNVYDDLAQTRNIFEGFKVTGDEDTDLENYTNLREEYAGGDSANIRINTAEDGQKVNQETGEVELDENNNPIVERRATGSDVDTSSASGTDATTKATSFVSSVAAKVAFGANLTCAAWQVGNMISVAVSAAELYQSINYFLNTIESISKMMAGQGTESGVHQVLNFFTTPTTQLVVNPLTGQEVSVTGSPLQSEWARVILGGVAANTNNSTFYSFERLTRTALSVLGSAFTSSRAASACNVSRAVSAAISLGSLATGGIASIVVGGLINSAISIAVQVTLSGILSAFIPTVANAIFSNTYKQYESGIPGGEEFGRGAMAANSRISRSASGLMPVSAERNLAYQKLQSEVIARESAIDRNRRSPFDASSPNTFLGSILTKFAFVPVFNNTSLLGALTSGNLFSIASTITNATATSIGQSVSADGDFKNYLTTYGDCPRLTDIGAVGEMYCVSLLGADPSILDLDPEDPTYLSIISKSLETDEHGNEKIKSGSPLAKFITYAVNRDSDFGNYDANIASSCEKSFGLIVDNLSIVNDVLDIVNAFKNQECNDMASGLRYVNSDSNPYWDSEIKYYQYYYLRNRALDRLDYFDDQSLTNPVLAYREQYLAEHPLDRSRAGTLARISGLTKSDAETVLAFFDYYSILAAYDSSSAYYFGHSDQSPARASDEATTIISDYKSSEFTAISLVSMNATTPAAHPVSFYIRREGITA